MLGTSWECHKVREFALRPMGDFLLVLDLLEPFSSRSELPQKIRVHVKESVLASRM